VKPSHFVLLALLCLMWGLNLVGTRWVVEDLGVDPLFYAFLRFAAIALVLVPFLFPLPRPFGVIAIVALCIGGGNFALLFMALANAPASAVAVVGQLGLPITTLLSMAFLGEKVRWRRGIGMALAFIGVVILSWKPGEVEFTAGVLFVVASAIAGSIGAIVMKRMPPVPLLKLQAWVAVLSTPPLALLTAWFEQGQTVKAMAAGWPFVLALLFSVFLVTIFAHSAYYWLLQKYEVTLLAPLTLMTPVWAILFAVFLLGETLDPRLLLGGGIALFGVAIVAIRPNVSMTRGTLTNWLGGLFGR
jgi:O-acetylserine/cysteine efflux transporter